VAVLGAPLRLGSISPGRCDLAPRAVRSALERFSTYDVERARDLRELAVRDAGDLPLAASTPEEALAPLSQAAAAELARADALVLLGGDNSVTRAGVRALGPLHRSALLTFDAHFDLRDLEGGLTNGNPVRALLADGLPGANIAQIGIQGFANSRAYAAVAREAGIRVAGADTVHERGIDRVTAEALDYLEGRADAIYVDFDLDVLDRAFAPGTPGSRPGGLAAWQARRAARACGLRRKVKVLDLVEIDPERDLEGLTALAAAACLLEFCSGLHERLGGGHA
jgi:formiminoglutamase